jgi:hypothetical protein
LLYTTLQTIKVSGADEDPFERVTSHNLHAMAMSKVATTFKQLNSFKQLPGMLSKLPLPPMPGIKPHVPRSVANADYPEVKCYQSVQVLNICCNLHACVPRVLHDDGRMGIDSSSTTMLRDAAWSKLTTRTSTAAHCIHVDATICVCLNPCTELQTTA